MRSGTLTGWVRSWRTGLVPLDDVVAAVTGDDAEHDVADLPGQLHVEPLAAALGRLSTVDSNDVRVVLPTAGDPRGLPGPGDFSAAALAAGEGVRCGHIGLVPEVADRMSGSGDVWRTVTWRAYPLPAPAPSGDILSLADAEHDLLTTLRDATEALQSLDVARWRPQLADALAELRRPTTATHLPPGYDPRADRVLQRAEIVMRIVGLAAEDAPGGAVSAHEAIERDRALRPLATAARRATVAAYNSPVR